MVAKCLQGLEESFYDREIHSNMIRCVICATHRCGLEPLSSPVITSTFVRRGSIKKYQEVLEPEHPNWKDTVLTERRHPANSFLTNILNGKIYVRSPKPTLVRSGRPTHICL
jgi:hypothetical protein